MLRGRLFWTLYAGTALPLLPAGLVAVIAYPALGVAVTVLGLGLGFLWAWWLTRRIASLAAAAEAVAAGDYAQQVESPSRDELGRLARAFNTLSQELRASTAAAEVDRRKLEAILASMVEGVIAVDPDQRVVHVNDVAGRMLEVEPAAALGRPLWEVTRIREVIEAPDEISNRKEVVHRVVRLPGFADRVYDLHASPLLSDSGSGDTVPGGTVLVLNDVTQLRRLETVRRDFLGNVSHELKTPVTAIRGLIETVLDDPKIDPATRQRFLSKIRTQTERMANLVIDLLALSRFESTSGALEVETFDVRHPAAASIRSLQPASAAQEITIAAEMPAEPLYVNGDEEALRQAISNLIDNAVKYSPLGGTVTVRARADGAAVVLEVEDRGPGIARRDRERIFERFYRVDKARSRELGGTGLGLAIVKHVALAFGGEVEVDSQPGRGSVFRIRLPAVKTPPDGHDAPGPRRASTPVA